MAKTNKAEIPQGADLSAEQLETVTGGAIRRFVEHAPGQTARVFDTSSLQSLLDGFRATNVLGTSDVGLLDRTRFVLDTVEN